MWNFIKQILSLLMNLIINLLVDAFAIYLLLTFIVAKNERNIISNNDLSNNHIVVTKNRPIIYDEDDTKHFYQHKPAVNHRQQVKKEINKLPKPLKATSKEKEALIVAQRFWIKELGFNPFWKIPIYWHTSLPIDKNSKLQPLGVTKTLVGDFPLTENKSIAYMKIDDDAAKKQHIPLSQVLAHEWGHALGLKHGYGIMEPIASNMSWKINKQQKAQIERNYQAGH